MSLICISSNYYINITSTIFALYSFNLLAPLPRVTISRSPGIPTAGRSFHLICTVTLEDDGSLTEDLNTQWITQVDISTVQVMTTNSNFTRTSTLRFTPVLTSHRGNYTCKATATGGADMAAEILTVQSKIL